jgi:hypothetical protein
VAIYPNYPAFRFLTTNVTGDKYQTGNFGTDDEKVGDIIQSVCAAGVYSGGLPDTTKKVIPAVWTGRTLTTSAITIVSPTADYIARRGSVKSAGLRRALSSVYNRVIIRYKDTSGNLARVTVNDHDRSIVISPLITGAGRFPLFGRGWPTTPG